MTFRIATFVFLVLQVTNSVFAQELKSIPPDKDRFTVGAAIYSLDSSGKVIKSTAPIFRRSITGVDYGIPYAIAEICFSSAYQTDRYSDMRVFLCLNTDLDVFAIFPKGTNNVSKFHGGISISHAGHWIDPIPGKVGAMSIHGDMLFDNNQFSVIRVGSGWAAAINPILETEEFTRYEICYKNIDGRTAPSKTFELNAQQELALTKTFPFIDFDMFDIINDSSLEQYFSGFPDFKDFAKNLNTFIKDIP